MFNRIRTLFIATRGRTLVRLALLLCLMVALSPLDPTRAATIFNVNQQTDAYDFQPGDGHCDVNAGTSGDQCAFRAAIQEANVLSGTEEIVIPPGTFTLTLQALLKIEKTVSIKGAGAGQTFIDGNKRSVPVIQVSGTFILITGVTIQHGHEGGIVIEEGGGLIVTHSAIRDNRATSSGAGINNFGGLELHDSTVDHNIVEARGGGLNNSSTGYIGVTRSTISNNEANQGGGIYNFGELYLRHSTLSGNKAQFSGGAIINNDRTYLTSVTITNNEANSEKVYDQNPKVGGGIFNNGAHTVELGNTILAGNTNHALNQNGAAEDCFGTFISRRYNIVGDGNSCTLDDPLAVNTPNDQVGTYVDPIDVQLGPLGAHGGPTLTHPLQQGSPARDTGVPNAETCGALDQRGATRPQSATGGDTARCDIGAFEVNVAKFTGISPSTHVAGTNEALTLTIIGSGFVPGSIVTWSHSERPTTYVSANKLTAQLYATDLAQPGTIYVRVIDPVTDLSGTAQLFTITDPPTPTATATATSEPTATATATSEPTATATSTPVVQHYDIYLPLLRR